MNNTKKQYKQLLIEIQPDLLKSRKQYILLNGINTALSLTAVAGVSIFAFVANPIAKLVGLCAGTIVSVGSIVIMGSKKFKELEKTHKIQLELEKEEEFDLNTGV